MRPSGARTSESTPNPVGNGLFGTFDTVPSSATRRTPIPIDAVPATTRKREFGAEAGAGAAVQLAMLSSAATKEIVTQRNRREVIGELLEGMWIANGHRPSARQLETITFCI
ncbi:hypothetical protein NN3_06370 [Nocardia neocaledoniensis NBRC 108232]|nr:hypothetical protein NN3_06370 [Nocardia neocaledoniensis NBRC 108232]